MRSGLAGSFITAWDDWAQRVLAGSRRVMGEAWIPAWLEAPVWRFALPAALCGPAMAVGLFMPSVDRVGRFFPLCFACLDAAGTTGAAAAKARTWLARAEAAGRAALAEDLPPEGVTARLMLPADAPPIGDEPEPPAAEADCGLWWTEGSPRVPSVSYALSELPDAARFVAMLDAGFRPADSGDRA